MNKTMQGAIASMERIHQRKCQEFGLQCVDYVMSTAELILIEEFGFDRYKLDIFTEMMNGSTECVISGDTSVGDIKQYTENIKNKLEDKYAETI